MGQLTTPLLIALAACAGAVSSANDVRAPRSDTSPFADPTLRDDPTAFARAFLMQDLGQCRTAVELRTCLEADLPRSDLHYVGFDQVTIAQCIDNIIPALETNRVRPDDARAQATMSEWIDCYVAAVREARIRRSIGTQSCLPFIR